jgi:hypothetical protein
MSESQERHYNILKLNRLFAISTFIFTGVWLLVFVDDYQRPWKTYQKEFRKLEIEKVRSDLNDLSVQLENNPDYNRLTEKLFSSEKRLDSRRDELDKINVELETLNTELYRNNQLYQFSKADLDVLKYDYETSRHCTVSQNWINIYNEKKTKGMIAQKIIEFHPKIRIDKKNPHEFIDFLKKKKNLGFQMRSYLKTITNTEYICKRVYKKMWILRRLKNMGCQISELVLVVKQQIQ